MEPVSATRDKFPYEEKLFSLSVRNAPLEQVLLALAVEAQLNLVIDQDVDRYEPISVEFNNISFDQALSYLMGVQDYFYDVKDSVLHVKAMQTEVFTIDYPLVYSKAESKVGGDMLGGATKGGDAETIEAMSNMDFDGEFKIEVELEDEEHLNIWKKIEDALQPARTSSQAGVTLLSPKGSAQVNRMAGSIIVTDGPKNLKLVRQFLSDIQSSLSRQVLIEAKIIEVQLNDGHQYGIDWNYIRENFVHAGGDLEIGVNLAPTSASTFSLKWTDPRSYDQGDFLINALKSNGEVNVLSAPRLNVLNNQSALISVGKIVPFLDYKIGVSQNTDTSGSTGTTIESVPVVSRFLDGLTLGITPQISEDGVTTLHIVPIITEEAGERVIPMPDLDEPVSIPLIAIRESDTMVSVEDQTTIVIGGLIVEKNDDASDKIPVLGDVPYLGALFSHQARQTTKAELVIMLTPTIVTR
jgi:MSHA biogenesis protein MshL